MSIHEKIHMAMYQFKQRTGGVEPRFVYLGEAEFKDFEQEAAQMCRFKIAEDSSLPRGNRYADMRVVAVKESVHCRCGI